MNIVIRPANLQLDRELLIDCLLRYLTPLSDTLRFEWLYRKNPHGQARVWIATDMDKGVIVGSAAAFPRLMTVCGREKLGWVLGDFCVNDEYRSLGPALQLQRACLAGVDSGGEAFCYDFPSDGMMAIYKRLHVKPLGQMLRLAKPLRVDRRVAEIVKPSFVARRLSAMGNVLLGLRDHMARVSGALTTCLHQGYCGRDFSLLAREASSCYGVCVQRSAEYLNWRYLANPLCCYELLTARRNGALVAYAVITRSGEDATLMDLFGINEPAIISGLVNSVIDLLRKRGTITVNAPIFESHPWATLLRGLGFRVRDARPVVAYAHPSAPARSTLQEGTRWFLMQGDRDS